MSLLVVGGALIGVLAGASPAAAQTCYRQPFPNPTLSDGWGSTCCGRTNPHRGVDYPQGSGTNIPAVADGVVRLKTSSGCLGNVVVVEHPDGMFSGYSHMLSQSNLSEGQAVARGETVGRVGNTGSCSFGAHLHLTLAPTVGGYASGTTVDPYAYIQDHLACNRAPTGFLDAAGCDGITGWAQDPDSPSAPVDVQISIGGPRGDPAAYTFNVAANVHRDDLCQAIGSCAHGFDAAVPGSFFDSTERPVFAYATDAPAGSPPLQNAPRTLRCDDAPLPTFAAGRVRRHVPSVEVLDAWGFRVVDIAPLADATLDELARGPDVTAAPQLVRREDDARVFVREGDVLRHVPDLPALAAWGFAVADIAVVPAADLEGTLEGTPLSAAPFLAQGSTADVFLVDSAPPLWADAIEFDVPAFLEVNQHVDVTLRLKNRGHLAWGPDTAVVVVAGADGATDSALCDSSWPACDRPAVLADTAPGADATVTVRLRAPATLGAVTTCFGLAHQGHAFSGAAHGGPAADALCRTVEVVAPGALPPGAEGEGEPALPPSVVSSGCGCGQGDGVSLVSAAAGLALLSRRRRRKPRVLCAR